MPSGLLMRIIIAVVVVLILFALIAPVLSIFNTPQSGNLETILRVVIGGLALLYVLTGEKWFA